jgi:NADPH:quinone reductase-like Zn-dependent oxidoreductase
VCGRPVELVDGTGRKRNTVPLGHGKEDEMRAIAEERFGGPIALMDLPGPKIGKGEVLIRARAAGTNPFDWKVADGALEGEREHRFPLILGFDAAGVVERVGAGVTGLAEAAAQPTPGLTAMDLVEAADPREGETALVVGATGGVGSYAVQLAARRGARVIVTARRANEAFVRKLGTAETIDHTREDIVESVRAAHPEGIETIIDVVSAPDVLSRMARLLKKGGRLASSVYAADTESLAERSIDATNVGMQPSARRLEELSWRVDAGEISVSLDRTFTLEKAHEALEEIKKRHVRGKIVLLVE